MTEQPPSAPPSPDPSGAEGPSLRDIVGDDASTPPPGTPPAGDGPTGSTIPLDADDTRSHHFRQLFRGPAPLIVTALFVIGAGVGGAIAVGPAVGAAAGGGAVLFVLVCAWLLANSRAEADFFKAYASGHSLQLEVSKGSLPPATPLLRRGDARYTKCKMLGALSGGQQGTLALYTYEETSTDSKGNRHTTYIHFTVMMAELSEFAPFMAELYAQRRAGFRFLDGAEDMFRKRQRVEHESEAVDKRYEIFCGAEDELNRARQVLSPQFLVWLQEHSTENFAFECVAGMDAGLQRQGPQEVDGRARRILRERLGRGQAPARRGDRVASVLVPVLVVEALIPVPAQA